MSPSSKFDSRRKSDDKVKKGSDKKKKKSDKKVKKSKSDAKSLKEKSEVSLQVVVGKVLGDVERLGSQMFALSPFSQYYDDWLVNLRQVVLEFESVLGGRVDEVFVGDREQAFLDVRVALAECRVQESVLGEADAALFSVKRELEEVDADYAEQCRELSKKRDVDTQQTTVRIKVLEEDLAKQEKLKFSFFQFGAKKAAAKRLDQTQKSLTASRKQLEDILQGFTVEQNKLQGDYAVRKQELSDRVNVLRKKAEQLEVDASIEVRKKVCVQLSNSVNDFVKRLSANPSN
jgi:hypothetical protein